MKRSLILRVATYGFLAIGLWAQEPDAQRTKQALDQVLEHYPPALRSVLTLDPSLMGDQAYLAPYPGLVSFLGTHPEVARNPTYYIGTGDRNARLDRAGQIGDLWRSVFSDLGIFLRFGMAIGLLTWLIRTLIDYRRWSKLTKVQTEVHTKLLDRFTANEDLVHYMQSPAGSKFLQSAPIMLDATPRSMGAPFNRILWSLQAGVILAAAGAGLQIASSRISEDAAQPLHVMGILGMMLGLGFAVSALVSYFISMRLGLIGKVPDVS